MTKPVTTQSIVLPPPISGFNKKDPLANLQPNYATWVEGFSSLGGVLKLREGFVVHCNSTDGDPDYCLGLAVYKQTTSFVNNDQIFAISYNGVTDSIIQNFTTSTPSTVHTYAENRPDYYISRNFGTKLLIFATDPYYHLKFDGTTWSAFAPSSPSLAAFNDGYGYKGRLYLYQNYGVYGNYYYGDVGAVAGTFTAVEAYLIFSGSTGISYITSITISDVISSEEFFCIGSQSGEILIYSGDYPGAANWTLTARFLTAPPLGRSPIVQVNGDVFIITENGIVSMRALFQYGNQAASSDFSLSAVINPQFTKLIQAVKNNVTNGFKNVYQWASGTYWSDRNSVIFNIWGSLTKDGVWTGDTEDSITSGDFFPNESTIFEYNLTTGSWVMHRLGAILTQLYVANKKLYGGVFRIDSSGFGTSVGKYAVLELYKNMTFKDEILSAIGTYQGINYDIISAPLSIGGQQSVKRVVGVEPILNTDSYGASQSTYYMKVITDFGRSTSAASYQPISNDGYTRAYFSVGAEGTFFQYELAGTTNKDETIGLELYSTNVYFEQGGNR